MTSPIPPTVPETGTGAVCAYGPLARVIVAVMILLAGAFLASAHRKEPNGNPLLARESEILGDEPVVRDSMDPALPRGPTTALPGEDSPLRPPESPSNPGGLAALVESVQGRKEGLTVASSSAPPSPETSIGPAADVGEDKYAQIYSPPEFLENFETKRPEPPAPFENENRTEEESPPVARGPVPLSSESPPRAEAMVLKETPLVRDLQDALLPKFRYAENHRPQSVEEPQDPFLEGSDLSHVFTVEVHRPVIVPSLDNLRPLEEKTPAKMPTGAIPPFESLRPLEKADSPPNRPSGWVTEAELRNLTVGE